MDVDGHGGIDFGEFEAWWDSTPLVPTNHWMRLLMRDKTNLADGDALGSPFGKPTRRGGIFLDHQESEQNPG
jgi:hypothetical protein